jgi:ferredoxin-NADP reductase/Na+-translocating ferredoxin:NAD+ oxidoreductase RnfD subunit
MQSQHTPAALKGIWHKTMIRRLDKFLDGITMYRLMLYYLGALLAAAFGLSVMGNLHYNPFYLAISTALLIASCWLLNRVFAAIFNAPVNAESSIITALILALIITPKPTSYDFLFFLAAPGLAIASKYILTINRKHIFNPAAIAVALTAFGPRQTASWWVGTTVMLPFVLIGGVLVARKIRHERMIFSFFAATTAVTILYSLIGGSNVIAGLQNMALSSPAFFLGFAMLTEPLTSPTTAKKQNWYAVLVGFLLPPQVHIFNLYSSPELALIAGNIFAYVVSSKTKITPIFKQKLLIAANTLEFVFAPGKKFAYEPGQYMEFTVPHQQIDARGSRRYFTLASSPTEPDLRIGVKFYDKGSSFKRALMDVDASTLLSASQIAGNFTLPKDPTQKLVFIAGGIGVTPFRSMVKYLIDTSDHRAVTLLYSARTEADFAYKELFEQARQAIGLRVFYGVADANAEVGDTHGFAGYITAEIIQKAVPDYADAIFYVSGTHQMVTNMHDVLLGMGIHEKAIKSDFFPGYA